jgi:CRP-like cAMP-binding protein
VTLEQLVTRLSRLRVAAGETVFRQGDHCDRFYVVATGEVAVAVDGHERVELRAGDYFGEIALLRDVPRTATVRAQTDTELLALERDVFLAAVTGHAASAREADGVIAARLESTPGLL